MKKTQQTIAFGLTPEEAQAAQRTLLNKFTCAPENITVTTDPTIIYSLQGGDVIVGIKAHPTDQQQWSMLMPVCRYLKANDIKFQIIK